MTKEEYNEALLSPQWLSKRDKIKERDGYKCTKCPCKEGLEVHHTYYLKDKMPWQVPDECLITLCRKCHQKEHDKKAIKNFFRQKPPKEEAVKKLKSKKPILKLKKLKYCKFIAIESKTLKQIHTPPFDIKELVKLSKSIQGSLRGFDDEKSAKLWMKEMTKKRKTKDRVVKRQESLNRKKRK